MRPIDADALKLEIVEEGQRSKRYKIGEFWELNGEEIRQVIDAQPTMPTIERNGEGWIACSERLPEARQSVILSTKEWTGEGCYWETTEHHVIWKGYRWNATYWDDEVVAWMSLPQPYKGG